MHEAHDVWLVYMGPSHPQVCTSQTTYTSVNDPQNLHSWRAAASVHCRVRAAVPGAPQVNNEFAVEPENASDAQDQ